MSDLNPKKYVRKIRISENFGTIFSENWILRGKILIMGSVFDSEKYGYKNFPDFFLEIKSEISHSGVLRKERRFI